MGVKYYIQIHVNAENVPIKAVYTNRVGRVKGEAEFSLSADDNEYYAEYDSYGIFYYTDDPKRTWIQEFAGNFDGAGVIQTYRPKKSVKVVKTE